MTTPPWGPIILLRFPYLYHRAAIAQSPSLKSSRMIALDQRPGAADSAKIIRRAEGKYEKEAQGNRGTLSQVWLADRLQGR